MKLRVAAGIVLIVVAVTVFVLGRAGAQSFDGAVAGRTYAIAVTLDEARTGRITAEVQVRTGTATTVTLAPVMPSMGHISPEIATREAEPGRFVATADVFSMTGVWNLSVRVSGRAGEETLTVTVMVS